MAPRADFSSSNTGGVPYLTVEMMAALARAKALHKQLIAKRGELEEALGRAPHAPYAP